MPTLRAKVTFVVKEWAAEPCISVEQLDGDAQRLPENLHFELSSGTSLKEAQKTAAYLKETIKTISRVS